MVVDLEDFMRRRSKVEQVVRRSDIINDPGLPELATLFFGDSAGVMMRAYQRDS